IKRRNNVLYRRLIGKLTSIGLNQFRLLHRAGYSGRIRHGFFNAHATHGTTSEREETHANRSPAQSICAMAQRPKIVFVASRIDSQRYSLIPHAKDAGIMNELELTSGSPER